MASAEERVPMVFNGSRVLIEVEQERRRQDELWGEQNHLDGTGGWGWKGKAERQKGVNVRLAEAGMISWLDILAEEVYEAFAESNELKLREELIQVAAVAVAWAEAIDRRRGD